MASGQRASRAHRHFSFLAPERAGELFFRLPEPFDGASDPELLSHVLGATLYSRANQPNLGERIRSAGSRGVTSTVVCLEDAIADRDLDAALEAMVGELSVLAASTAARPL